MRSVTEKTRSDPMCEGFDPIVLDRIRSILDRIRSIVRSDTCSWIRSRLDRIRFGWIRYNLVEWDTSVVDRIRSMVDQIQHVLNPFANPMFVPFAMVAWFPNVYFFLCKRWSNMAMQGIQEVVLHEFKCLRRFVTMVADLIFIFTCRWLIELLWW